MPMPLTAPIKMITENRIDLKIGGIREGTKITRKIIPSPAMTKTKMFRTEITVNQGITLTTQAVTQPTCSP